VLVAAPLAIAAVVTACSLDWTVRPSPLDGSASETSVGVDATDAPVGLDAADTSVPIDAPVSPEAAACDGLTVDVAQKRAKARECQIGMPFGTQCTTTVDDQCGCKVVVTFADAGATNDYTAAVGNLIAVCGKPACTAPCPQLGVPGSWACLANGGTSYSCQP
jgi:hypothetical protein